MKKLINISLILLLAVVFCAPAAVSGTILNPNNETYIKVGSKLVYAIDKDGKKYNLTVTIKSLAPQVSFDWQTSAPANGKGSITMAADAKDHATGIITNFKDGAVALDKESAIWLSTSLMNQIQGEGRLMMTLDGKDMPAKVVHFNEPPVVVKINGADAKLSTIIIHNGMMDASKKTITFLDSKDFPIVVKMDIGWTMTLKSISN